MKKEELINKYSFDKAEIERLIEIGIQEYNLTERRAITATRVILGVINKTVEPISHAEGKELEEINTKEFMRAAVSFLDQEQENKIYII